jgi:hypothetical protein
VKPNEILTEMLMKPYVKAYKDPIPPEELRVIENYVFTCVLEKGIVTQKILGISRSDGSRFAKRDVELAFPQIGGLLPVASFRTNFPGRGFTILIVLERTWSKDKDA